MAIFKTIDEFTKTVSDFQRKNLYLVTLQAPPGMNEAITSKLTNGILTVLCKTVDTPTQTINTKKFAKRNRAYTHATGHTYDDITLTFLLDQEGLILAFFEEWMYLISDRSTHTVNYKNAYQSNKFKIELYDRTLGQGPRGLAAAPSLLDKGKQLLQTYGPSLFGSPDPVPATKPAELQTASCAYEVFNAWPVSKQKLTFQYGPEGTPAELNVTFNYDTYSFTSKAYDELPFHADKDGLASDKVSLDGVDKSGPLSWVSAGSLAGHIETVTKLVSSGAGTITGAISDVSAVGRAVAGTFPGTKLAEQINSAITKAGTTSGKISSEVGAATSRAGNASGGLRLADSVVKGKTQAGTKLGSFIDTALGAKK